MCNQEKFCGGSDPGNLVIEVRLNDPDPVFVVALESDSILAISALSHSYLRVRDFLNKPDICQIWIVALSCSGVALNSNDALL